MKKKEFIERCQRVFFAFDSLHEGSYCAEDFPISNYFDYFKMLESKGITGEMQDKAADVMYQVRGIAFAFGFVIGQKFDLTPPYAQTDIETIYREIKKHGLLPRERRAKKAA